VWIVVKCVTEVAPKTPRAVGVNDKNEKRFTCGGTQVPSGTPLVVWDLALVSLVGLGYQFNNELGIAMTGSCFLVKVQIGTVDTLDQISLGGLIGMLVWRLRNRIYDLTNVMTVGPLQLLSMVYLVFPPVYVLTVGLVQAWCLGNIVNITVNVMTVGLQLARFSVEFLINLREYVMKFGLLKALCLVFNILVLLYVLTIGLLALVVGLLGRVIKYFLLGTNNFLTEVFVIPRWMVVRWKWGTCEKPPRKISS